MIVLSKDFKEFVELLIKHEVEYLIVGGYAVGIHGHPRYTGDLDIWLKISESNAQKILLVIHEFGFSSLQLAKDDFLKPGTIVQLGHPPLRIDILTQIDGVTFDDAYLNKKETVLDNLHLSIIGFNDLIKNKKASGRYKDLNDLENLDI